MCSTLGQSFTTSIDIGENIFAIILVTLGLILLALLIGNMQVSLSTISLQKKKKITYITFRRNGSFTEKIVKIMNHLMWASVWQRFLQSTTIRLEEWKIKRTDTENWMHHRHLPPDLRQIVRKYDLYKWLSNKGVDEESLIKHLPVDLQRKVKHHLCFDLLRRVSLPF